MGKYKDEMRFGILKMINYKMAGMAEAEKLTNYIKAEKATKPELVFSNYLSPDNPFEDMKIIEKRFNNNRSNPRLFKQCVLSFGCTDMEPRTAVEITKDIFNGFYPQNPWFAAVHINVPRRIHTHCLLSTANLKTKTRLSQSKQDLQELKDYYDTVVKKYGLPGLRRLNFEEDIVLKAGSAFVENNETSFVHSGYQEQDSYYFNGYSYGCMNSNLPYGYMIPGGSIKPVVENPVTSLCNMVDEEFTRYFNLGKRGHF